jgi:hypothetical protein
MRPDVARDYWDDRGLALLWAALLLGPLAVSIDLGAGYALVKPLCASGQPQMLRAISIAVLILSGIGLTVGAWCFARLRRSAVDDGGRVIDRSYFTALVAVGLNLLSILLIATAGGARVIMPCE